MLNRNLKNFRIMKTKNIFKKLSGLILIAAVFVSCEKDLTSENLSTITYYPVFEKTGPSLVLASLGTAFTDPGIKAIENGKEIPVTTTVTGTIQGYSGIAVNSDVADEYLFQYSATNSDGFKGNDSRTVWIAKTGDLVTSIEGLYTSTVERNGNQSAQYKNMAYVLIYKTGANTYKISDGIGGYYAIGRAYGAGYRAGTTTITANNIATNDFSIDGTFGVGAFGGVATLSGITVDPVAKTVSFITDWDAGYTFVVKMTQVQI
jgi:hypothetical protein